MAKQVTDPELLKALRDKYDTQREPVPVPREEMDDNTFSPVSMMKNIPGSAVQFGKDVITPIMNPIDTVKGLGQLAGSAFAAGEEKLVEMAPPEWVAKINEINNAIADKTGLLTRLPKTKEEMVAENTETFDAVAEFYNDRYGSWDKTKKTVERDPVGFLGDASAVVSGGAGLMRRLPRTSAALQRVGSAADPLNVATNVSKGLLSKVAPAGLPPDLYQRAAKFSGGVRAPDPEVLTKTALDYNLMPNMSGIGKLEVLKHQFGQAIDQMVNAAEASGTRIPKGAVFKHLGELRKEMGGVKLRGAKNKAAIDQIAKDFDEHMKALKRDTLTPRELQDFKIDIYEDNKYGAKTLQGTRIGEKTEKAFARAAKEILEQESPDIREANRELGRLKELQPELERVGTRNSRRNLLSIDTPLQMMAGSQAAGPFGTAGGLLSSLFSYPNVTAGTALRLNNMQKAGPIRMMGDYRPFPTLIGRGLFQTGRLQNQGLLPK